MTAVLVLICLAKGKTLPAIFLLMHYGIRKYGGRCLISLVPVKIRGSREHQNQCILKALFSFPLLFIFKKWVGNTLPCSTLARESLGKF